MTSRRKGTRMNVEIAQRLAAMRREKGYSQEELANRLAFPDKPFPNGSERNHHPTQAISSLSQISMA